MTPQEKIAIEREYERLHLQDMEELARRADDQLREMAKVKKERTKGYEESIKRRIALSDPMLDITDEKQIGTYIKRKYREVGVQQSIISYVEGWIEPEHKVVEEQPIIINNGDGTQTVMDSYEKPIDRLDSKELVEKDEWISEQQKKLKAELKRLNDIQELVYSKANETNLELPSMKDDVISTPKPEPGDSEFAVVIDELAETFVKIAAKVREFPPQPEDAKTFADAGRMYLKYLKPLTDEKYAVDFRGWLEVIKTYDEYGKHAAAVKHSVQTNDGKKRPLTREQVGDKVNEVLENSIAMYDVDPLLVSFSKYHTKYIRSPVATRRDYMNPKLSERA